jgi:hypothetical protein
VNLPFLEHPAEQVVVGREKTQKAQKEEWKFALSASSPFCVFALFCGKNNRDALSRPAAELVGSVGFCRLPSGFSSKSVGSCRVVSGWTVRTKNF